MADLDGKTFPATFSANEERKENDYPEAGVSSHGFLFKKSRFVPAVLMAVFVHAALFRINISSNPVVTAPRPLQVQRIAVSLGSRPAPKKKEVVQPQEPESQPIVEPVSEAVPDPVKQPVEPQPPVPVPEPKPKPVVPEKRHPTMVTPRPVRKKKVSRPRPVPNQVAPAEVQVRKNIPSAPSPVTEQGDDNSQSKSSARVIQKASPLYQVNPPPKYPRPARRRGYEGVVVLDVSVDPSGCPVAVRLSTSSGYSLLDNAAIKAIWKWRFQPGTVDGAPRQMTVKVPIRFRLDDA